VEEGICSGVNQAVGFEMKPVWLIEHDLAHAPHLEELHFWTLGHIIRKEAKIGAFCWRVFVSKQ